MGKKRDAAYYEGRLKRDFPKIYADLCAGKRKSVRQAAAQAGLIRLPNRVDALKREWKRSSQKQRIEFIDWVKLTGIGVKVRSSARIANASGVLMPRTIAFLNNWTRQEYASPGKIMKQMGYSNNDYRLARALKGNVALPTDVLSALDGWLIKHGF